MRLALRALGLCSFVLIAAVTVETIRIERQYQRWRHGARERFWFV